jgi:pimeloyl-ACP methyl ester carboxylesterase
MSIGAAASTVHHAVSVDGTRIGYRTSGSGHPLVMVHGGSADSTVLSLVAPLLESHYEVHAMDRRGRGLSGDGASYDVALEHADVAAVVEAVARRSGTRVSLYGHSYGALCALGAARLTDRLERLFLYEPAFRGVVASDGGGLDRLDGLVAAGRLDDALEHFYRRVVGMSAPDVAAMRAMPSWSARLAAVPALGRELRVAAHVEVDPAQVRRITVPTWCLVGDRSTEGQKAAVAAVHQALPRSTQVVLPGQAHAAQVTAPHLLASALLAPLAGSS